MTTGSLVDTHCHISDYFRASEVITDALQASVRVIAVTRLPSEYLRDGNRYAAFDNVRVALGIHPLTVHRMSAAEWNIFARSIADAAYVGEVGLDFSAAGSANRPLQEEAFFRVLQATSQRNKLLTVHSRRAEKRVLDLLTATAHGPVILHWFSGKTALVPNFLSRGDYFSFNPSMLKSEKGRALVREVPIERILLESDGPFSKTSRRESWPSDISVVVHEIAKLSGKTPYDIARQINRNFQSIRSALRDRPEGT